MNYFEKLKTEFTHVLKDFNQSPAIQRIIKSEITIEHYKSLMRQIAHHARENPQLQTLATVYFRGYQRKAIKMFYKHATSEIGHDQLALNDIAACGDDITQIPYENPLPTTMALISFGFYQTQNLNPVGYLGYLFFLEFMPTQGGKHYVEALKKIGVPDNALSFIMDHTTIDMGHNKLMEQYAEQLIKNDEQYQAVLYAMKVTGVLYALMVQGAFEQIDRPKNYGFSTEEVIFCDNNLMEPSKRVAEYA